MPLPLSRCRHALTLLLQVINKDGGSYTTDLLKQNCIKGSVTSLATVARRKIAATAATEQVKQQQQGVIASTTDFSTIEL